MTPTPRRSFRAALVLLALACAHHGPSAQQGGTPTGVVIDAVEAASPAAMASLQPGDVLFAWRTASGEEGTFPDGWAFELFTLEVAPRAAAVLRVRRAGVDLDVAIPVRTSRVGLTVGPVRGDAGQRAAAWDQVRQADRLVTQRSFEPAERLLRDVLSHRAVSADSQIAALVRGRLSALAQRQARWEEALGELSAAEAAEPPEARSLMRAYWLLRRASTLRTRGSYDAAADAAERALAIRRELAAASWDEAEALSEIATIHLARRALDQAWTTYDLARQVVAPDANSAFELARIDFNLALVDFRRGRLADAERRLATAIAVTRARAPQSLEHARNLNTLGILRSQGGQLPDAARLFEESLALHRDIDPGGGEEASVTNNLGILAMQRGRFADAERHYRRSLELKEQLGLPPMDRASTIGNLGLMSVERRDLVSARSFLQQGLELVRPIAPDGPEATNALNNLARVERLSGNLAEAERFARRGLDIRSRVAPNTVLHAFSLTELGKTLEAVGRLDEAADVHRQAFEIRQQLLPDGTNAADSLDALGRLARRRGQLDEAARLHAQAGAIWGQMAPDSVYEAVNLVEQARVASARGRSDEALASYERATRILDDQTGNAGGSFETLADFRNGLAAYYTEYAELLIARGRTADAFAASERGRTRAFLALVAERDLELGSDIPASLDARRRTLSREYERVQSDLSALSPTRDALEVQERTSRLRDVKLELAAVNADVARSAGGLARIRAATPLGAAAAQALLSEDTVAVSYVVGARTSQAFVLTRTALEVFQIPLGRAAIDEHVTRLRRLIERPGQPTGALQSLSRDLYQALISPAAEVLARRSRLLVVPDGPLHSLPFAALVRNRARTGAGGGQQYLIEWRPVFQVPSLTVFAQLQAGRPRTTGRDAVLAVGDPHYEPDAKQGTQPALTALPGTRREVQLLAAVYGAQAEVLVGEEATEPALRRRLSDADIVHIAAHGVVNERFPLDSALALSTPTAAGDRDNGLLQGWEIIEQVRLKARLVVLSACDTAGVGDGSGEGLLGLTRAFHIAGAPSVLASLWRVPDDVTPDLMRQFHRHVQAGIGLDEALARAQRKVLGTPGTAHPFYWASFVLNGRR